MNCKYFSDFLINTLVYMAIKFIEINIKDIVFSPLQDNVYIPSQRISWINKADNSKLLAQTPKFIT